MTKKAMRDNDLQTSVKRGVSEGEKPRRPKDSPVTGLMTAQERKDIRKQEGETGKKKGRPSNYSEDEADALCAWMQGGESLSEYCRQTGRASQSVYAWMRERPDFLARYTRACDDRADTLADQIIAIADESAVDASIESVAAAKLRVEARKWVAAKLRPQKWGDKVIQEYKGAVSIRIGVGSDQAPEPLQMVDEVRPGLPSVPGMRLNVASKA